MYDFSNFPSDHKLYSEDNKKVSGKFKDEEVGKNIEGFMALRAKLYSYKTDQDVVKKCKGIKKNVVKNEICYDEYEKVLLEKIMMIKG
jgi:hypothetical protein